MVASYGSLVLNKYARGYVDGSVAIALVDAVAQIRADAIHKRREDRRYSFIKPERAQRELAAVKAASFSAWAPAEDACNAARIDWREAYREAWARRSRSMKRRRDRRGGR